MSKILYVRPVGPLLASLRQRVQGCGTTPSSNTKKLTELLQPESVFAVEC